MNAAPPETALPEFNLVDQPWLLVRDIDGGVRELSTADTLRQAHELAGLAGDVPTQVFALTRLLLAVLHSALRGPVTVDEWERLWDADGLPMAIESYLAAHRDRFALFHPSAPFMQVADLRTAKGEVSELSKLIADVPNGHRFFATRLGGDLSLSYAEAARWLVHCQAFDPSGIKSGAVGDDRVKGGKGYPIGVAWSGLLGGILPEGRTLRETLLLNLISADVEPRRDPARDIPVWEREPLGPTEQPPERVTPAGPVSLFTWQSRRIRLRPERGRVTGVLICNGDRLTPQNMHTTESHTAWRRSQAQEKARKSTTPIYMPLEHTVERVIWRGLGAMLPDTGGPQGKDPAARLSSTVTRWLALLTTEGLLDRTYPVRMRTIGMTYGANSSVTAEIIDDALSIQAVLVARDAAELKGAVVTCVEVAESAARALGYLAGNLARAAGGTPDGPRERATETAYATLDPLFRTWLANLGPGTDALDCQATWQRQANTAIRQLGIGLVVAASPDSWVGRTHSGRFYSTSHADAWFGTQLRGALPLAYPHKRSESVPA